MRGTNVIFGIVVVILWYLAAFYIAAPHEVHNMIAGGFGMTHQQHQLLGVLLFVVSLLVIMIWAISGKPETSESVKIPTSAVHA